MYAQSNAKTRLDHFSQKQAGTYLGRDLGKLLPDETWATTNSSPDAQSLLQQVSNISVSSKIDFIIFSVALQRENKY